MLDDISQDLELCDFSGRSIHAKLSRQGKRQARRHDSIITGADSGIGHAVAVLFAREGADVGIVYLSETQDAEETRSVIAISCGLSHACTPRGAGTFPQAIALAAEAGVGPDA